jgi:hypothetical protein
MQDGRARRLSKLAGKFREQMIHKEADLQMEADVPARGARVTESPQGPECLLEEGAFGRILRRGVQSCH